VRYVGWRCRLYPNASQGAALLRCRNALRELANTLLANSQLSYTETGRRLTLAELRKVTRDWRGEALDQGCPASAIYRVAADLDRAFRNWFAKSGGRRRKGFPEFKAIGREPGIYVSNQAVRFEGNRVRLPKFGWMRWRGGNLPPGRLAGPSGRKTRGLLSGRVWLDAGGRWMLSCLFECAPLAPVEPRADRATVREKDGEITVSVDGGLGRVIRESGALRNARRRLARLERRLARCEFGSEGRKRALALMRNQARKVRNLRADLLHKATTGVVQEVREIEVEGVGAELLRQLEYKAEWHGRKLKVRRGPPEPGNGKPRRARRPGSRSRKRESRTRRPEAL